MGISWRFVPPNLVTCISLTAGLLGISEAVVGRFESSAWWIVLCMLLDKADGTVARLLKASSRFGLELDSLADLICFCVAPAVLVLSVLVGPGRQPGLEETAAFRSAVYAGCFLYVICGALRLAKFNVVTEGYGTQGKDYFFGFPTTPLGAFIATYYLSAVKYELPRLVLQLMPGLLFLFALLMVSRIPMPKLKVRKSLLSNILVLPHIPFFYTFGFLRIFPEYIFVFGLGYLTVGSIWGLTHGVKPPRPADAEPEENGEQEQEQEQEAFLDL